MCRTAAESVPAALAPKRERWTAEQSVAYGSQGPRQRDRRRWAGESCPGVGSTAELEAEAFVATGQRERERQQVQTEGRPGGRKGVRPL